MNKIKILSMLAALAVLLSFSACSKPDDGTGVTDDAGTSSSETADTAETAESGETAEIGTDGSSSSSGSSDSAGSSSDTTASETAPDPVVDTAITAKETTDGFSITTKDGKVTSSGSTYTLTAGGVYTLTGALDGQIIVEAADTDEVELELSGVTLTNSADSPVKILSASKVEISAKADTDNVIKDTRSAKTADDEAQGEGAIYAKCDLKLKGTGTLVIEAGYNNGVHTTHDLTVQKLSLKVTAYNNAIKGNDSITVKSGTVAAVSTNGDGVKTENTDAAKDGSTRGDITLEGGSITVYAAGDGFQAAHNFEMIKGEDGTTPTVAIYTGAYSGYTASDASTTSYKGVKAQNELNVNAGSIDIKSYDDGLHADAGTAFDAGGTGSGTVNITGGTVNMSVYSPEGKTANGMMGPGGFGGGMSGGRGGWRGAGAWGGQQTVSGADAIHADGTLNITGGTVNIDSSYEGLEANVINVSGGNTTVAAVDDGVNATKGASTPQINVTGGYLDVTVSANGDTDGIDSNGNYSQTGGVVITRGPNSEMAAAIDADGSVSVTGGTLIVLGYGRVSTGGSVKSYSLSLHSEGSHTVKIGGTGYTFENASAYGRTLCYSDKTVTA